MLRISSGLLQQSSQDKTICGKISCTKEVIASNRQRQMQWFIETYLESSISCGLGNKQENKNW
jgi:hypothetical protein